MFEILLVLSGGVLFMSGMLLGAWIYRRGTLYASPFPVWKLEQPRQEESRQEPWVTPPAPEEDRIEEGEERF